VLSSTPSSCRDDGSEIWLFGTRTSFMMRRWKTLTATRPYAIDMSFSPRCHRSAHVSTRASPRRDSKIYTSGRTFASYTGPIASLIFLLIGRAHPGSSDTCSTGRPVKCYEIRPSLSRSIGFGCEGGGSSSSTVQRPESLVWTKLQAALSSYAASPIATSPTTFSDFSTPGSASSELGYG